MQLVDRRSSVFTRLPLLFAEQLGVAYEFHPIKDMTETAPAVYAGNPALKLPILRLDGDVVFGAQNICRVIAEQAAAAGKARALHQLPAQRELSVFEVSLFCLIEHLALRPTVPMSAYAQLAAFGAGFGQREAARRTACRFD